MIHYQQATRRDIRRVVPFLRAVDILEIQATGKDPADINWLGHGDCFCVYVNRVPAGLMGVSAYDTIWMVGTDLLTRNSVEFLRACREELPFLIGGRDFAFNWVWENNKLHQRWLSWLGARWDPETITSITGESFRRFSIHV